MLPSYTLRLPLPHSKKKSKKQENIEKYIKKRCTRPFKKICMDKRDEEERHEKKMKQEVETEGKEIETKNVKKTEADGSDFTSTAPDEMETNSETVSSTQLENEQTSMEKETTTQEKLQKAKEDELKRLEEELQRATEEKHKQFALLKQILFTDACKQRTEQLQGRRGSEPVIPSVYPSEHKPSPINPTGGILPLPR